MSTQDPQATTGASPDYAPLPRCRCKHPATHHAVNPRTKRRGQCSAGLPNGVCSCAGYVPERAT